MTVKFHPLHIHVSANRSMPSDLQFEGIQVVGVISAHQQMMKKRDVESGRNYLKLHFTISSYPQNLWTVLWITGPENPQSHGQQGYIAVP